MSTLRLKYIIHSVVEGEVAVRAFLGGREVRATVPGLTVEMVDAEGGDAYGHTFRFTPDDDAEMAAHKAVFQAGKRVVAHFTPEEGE